MTNLGRFSQYQTAPVQSPSKMRDQFSRNRFPHSLLSSDAPEQAANTPVVCLLPATGEPIIGAA